MSIVCAISGDIPEVPVVSTVSGHVFEKRLLVKWVEDKGTDPVTNEPLSMDQTTDIKNSESVIRPRAPTWTSIPGILKCLQDEWDALMLHQYSLRDQLQNARQELSHSLYQHDAACRVIARLQKETADAKEALATLRPISNIQQEQLVTVKVNGHTESPTEIIEQPKDEEKVEEIIPEEDSGLPLTVVEEITKANEELTKDRKKRQEKRKKDPEAFASIAKQDEIMNFSAAVDYIGFHSSSHAGILDVAIDETQFPNHILTAGMDRNAVLFNCEKEQIAKVLKGHTKKLTRCMIHPSEPMGITASVDHTIKLWALNSRESFEGDTACVCLETFGLHKGTVSGISLHPIPNYLLSVGYDGVWNFIDLPNSTVLSKSKSTELEYTSTKVHPDGRIFATGTNNGGKSSVLIWDILEQTQLHEFEGHTDAVVSIGFSDNGYLMASGSRDGSCKIWDLRKLKCKETINVSENTVYSVSFDDSGSYLATSSDNGLKVFTTGKAYNELLKLQEHKSPVTSLCFGQGAHSIYTASMDNTVVMYNMSDETLENEDENQEMEGAE